jgi:hypothetical protein
MKKVGLERMNHESRFSYQEQLVVVRKIRSTSFHCVPARASSVVELWFVAVDFPKGALGADVCDQSKESKKDEGGNDVTDLGFAT